MLIASSQVKLTLFWTVSFTDWEKNPRWMLWEVAARCSSLKLIRQNNQSVLVFEVFSLVKLRLSK